MTVDVVPITEADVDAVSDFLSANHDGRVSWSRSLAAVPWEVTAPNRGFMLRDGGRIVGTLLAVYSDRLLGGRVERLCNMGSWCVLPRYRSRSILLLKALLAQDGYSVTVLSPDDGPREILEFFKFRPLDTSASLVPNLPWPRAFGRTRVSADPNVIERTLVGSELVLYRDHAQALAARHLLVQRGIESCYVMYREYRFKGVPLFAMILHVGDQGLFRRSLLPITRHLLLRHGLVATLAERRVIGCAPALSFKLASWPKMYRSATLEPAQIDDLYSELVCVPW
ncbi:hypothetical protein H7K45_00220 [Mycobacterium yunnanensis]|uniref:N-acetyltransferase domain-containing protein n=1 Tax=Mycobacterium yunnanensis TaxID=368477 RepID=A0A9X2YWJ9_9MYCO|nr:GNAT family N-acetyltransferase [Mycobacterium yunnanensis]MCV7418959.1 hypothetical protein [Mycobacterium yunnanensis]